MRKLLRKRMKRSQGMTEYIIIVGLIAIFVIVAVQKFGGTVNEGFEKSEEKLQKEVIGAINGG